MRDYGRVHATFWTSQDIRSLSEDGRTLAFYLLTSPHTTIVGAFRLPDGYVSEDLQWPPERVGKGFLELFEKGFANRCETTKWAWILKFLEWNPPENPNQWKAARKIASQIPEQCCWSADFQRTFAVACGDPEPPKGNPSGTVTPTVSKSGTGTGTGTGTGDAAPEGASPPVKRANGKKPKTALPEGFALDGELRSYAENHLPQVHVDGLFEGFCGKARAKSWVYADWRQAWQEYCRNCAPNSGHWASGQYPKNGAGSHGWT